MNPSRIEKSIELRVPPSMVWRALADFREFGTWFRVKLDGPFAEGRTVKGKITYPGYEHLKWEVVVQTIEPETLFSFTWHPYAIDPEKDYSEETPTLVEFTLEATPTGSLLRVSESGFDQIPEARREEAFRMNEQGWEEQMKNLAKHVLK